MRSLFIASCLALLISGCYNDKSDKLYPIVATPSTTCDTSNITYAHDIVPILTANCTISGGCHDAAGASTSGYDFTTYIPLARTALNGLLLGDITWAASHNPMPKNGGKLSDCDINKFRRWINQGALNN
jgi:hypothetical protein